MKNLSIISKKNIISMPPNTNRGRHSYRTVLQIGDDIHIVQFSGNTFKSSQPPANCQLSPLLP